MRWALAALVVLCLSSLAPRVHAQRRWARPAGEPTAAELDEARHLYERGSRAVDAYRFADGLRFFERSYELSGLGAALFGVAFALQSIGRFRDARDAFGQLLADHADLPDEFRERAERFRAENTARVATLELVGLPELAARLELDGAEVPDGGARPLLLECDPGTRRLRVAASGGGTFDWEGRVREAERIRIDVELAEGASGGSLWESPWLWIGGGVLVVAGAIVAGLLLHAGAQLDPTTPNHIVLCDGC